MKFELDGKKYTTLQACFNDNKEKITVGIATVRNRIKKDWDLSDALFKSKEKTIDTKLGSHLIEGVSYPNLPSISEEYGVPVNTIYKRYSRGHRGDSLIPPKNLKTYKEPKQKEKFKFFVAGKGYKSQAEACRQLNVKLVTFRSRRRKGWTNEQALNLEPVTDGRTTKGTKYTIDNNEYTVNDLSKIYSVPATTIKDRLERGAKIKQAIGLEEIKKGTLKTQSEVKQKRTKKPPIKLKAFGKTYKNYKELADEFGLDSTTVNQRIVKYNHSPEVAVTMQGKKKSITVSGKTYVSKAEFARAYNLSSANVMGRLKNGHTFEEIAGIKKRATSTEVEYQGRKYGSTRELAKAFGIPDGAFRSRRKSGKTISEVIKAGEKITNPGRYNLTILSRDKELANKSAIIYFVSITIKDKKRYKIGITVDTLNKRLKAEGHEFEKIKTMKGTLYDCYILEQQLHDLLSDKRDTSITSEIMDGYSEVFNLNKDDIVVVMDFLS